MLLFLFVFVLLVLEAMQAVGCEGRWPVEMRGVDPVGIRSSDKITSYLCARALPDPVNAI
jgi:hypothetical protein